MVNKITDTRRLETDRFMLTVAYSLTEHPPQVGFHLEILGTNQVNRKDLADLKDLIQEAIDFSDAAIKDAPVPPLPVPLLPKV